MTLHHHVLNTKHEYYINRNSRVEAVSVKAELSSSLFRETSVTVYSVPAVSPVNSTDVTSLAGVSVFTFSPSPTVTLYPVNISDSVAVHVTVSASAVLIVTSRSDGGLGTAKK